MQKAKLTAEALSWTGFSVAMSGDTVVAGAPLLNSYTGAVYVWVKPATGWTNAGPTAKLTASDGMMNDQLGTSVAISGQVVVAGMQTFGLNVNHTDKLYVWVKPSGGWHDMTETAQLSASDGVIGDRFGGSVAITNGNYIVTGASFAGPQVWEGAAYVYVKPSTGWVSATETAKLTASDGMANAFFGTAVAITGTSGTGTTIAVGAPASYPFSGKGYVFVQPAGGWVSTTETAQLITPGSNGLGTSVAMTGDTIVMGDPYMPAGKGSASLFEKPPSGWSQTVGSVAMLTAGKGDQAVSLGLSVAMTETQIVLGQFLAQPKLGGTALTYVRPKTGWKNMIQTFAVEPGDGQSGGYFGYAVGVYGTTEAIGAFGVDGNNGAVYVFGQ
jgi:hypothetical protein